VTDVAGSFEQQSWITVARELEDILLRGFEGKITLHCSDGIVMKYFVEEVRKPGEDRRKHERRTDGLRDGEDRRKG
jgi:hypothetical protein